MGSIGKISRQAFTIVAFSMFAVSIHSPNLSAGSEAQYRSKYAGQEKRDIKTLSAEDIQELRSGSGWGLAKAAELNGLPGPKHILEMKEEIGLTSAQERLIVALFNEMHKEAIVAGNAFIEYERVLNDRFAQRKMNEKELNELLAKISETYKSLRYIHLSAHLKTPGILTEDQIEKYNQLRGYSSEDPCDKIPKGHDPVMWRKHHDCD